MSKGANGALDTMLTFIEKFDSTKVTNAFSTMFSNINWNTIAEKLAKLFGNLIYLFNLPYLGAKIGIEILKGLFGDEGYFRKKAEPFGGNIILGFMKGMGDAIPDMLWWVGEHILMPFLKGIKEAFGIHSPSTVMIEQGKYITEGLLIGIESLVDKIGETWEKIKTTITDKIEEIKEKGKEIFEKLWVAILEGSQNAVNKCVDGFNKIIGGINELGQYFGLHLDEIQHVTWADEYKAEMDKMAQKTDETGKSITDTTGKTLDEMNKDVANSTSVIDKDTSIAFANVKSNITGNLGGAEGIVKTKTDYIKNLITGNFKSAKETAKTSVETIKKETETNLGSLSSSTVFSKLKSSIETALNNSEAAKKLGVSTASNFEEGVKTQMGSQDTKNSITSKIQSILGLSGNAYGWGQDMIKGFINGINSAKNTLFNTISSVANIIKNFLHFSRPDVGPLRDYETWMPDMIKGLSESLIKATPILNEAVSGVSNQIADSLSNIVMPEISESFFINQNGAQVIGNIANRAKTTDVESSTTNMIRATYEAVSKALSDNKSPEDNRQIIVNVGNKELYRGYGQYKDEQSNMLGITV